MMLTIAENMVMYVICKSNNRRRWNADKKYHLCPKVFENHFKSLGLENRMVTKNWVARSVEITTTIPVS